MTASWRPTHVPRPPHNILGRMSVVVAGSPSLSGMDLAAGRLSSCQAQGGRDGHMELGAQQQRPKHTQVTYSMHVFERSARLGSQCCVLPTWHPSAQDDVVLRVMGMKSFDTASPACITRNVLLVQHVLSAQLKAQF